MSKDERPSPYSQSQWERWEMQAFELPKLKHGSHILANNDEAEQPDVAALLADIEEKRKAAIQQGHQEGVELGRKEGYQQGFEEAREQGRKEGFEVGKKEGYDAGYADGKEQAQQQAQALATLLQNTASVLDDVHNQLGESVLESAVQIASHIVRTSLEQQPEQILALIQQLLHLDPDNKTPLTLYVNPSDAQIVNTFLQSKPHTQGWRVMEDATITAGGCKARTVLGDVDATLETRWRRAISSLNMDTQPPLAVVKDTDNDE